MKSKTLESLIDYDLSVGEDDPFSLDSEVNDLAKEFGWSKVLVEAEQILLDFSKRKKWYLAASVFCWAVNDSIAMPFEWQYLAGLLYGCLRLHPSLGVTDFADGDNLVWSIVHPLKGVGYMSDWQPVNDPEIVKIIQGIKWCNT